MTPEGKVKKKVTELLRSYGERVYFVMPVVSGMGQPQLDYVGCANGRYFTIETKAGKGVPTDRQITIFDAINGPAKGAAFLVNEEYGLYQLQLWLDAVLSK